MHLKNWKKSNPNNLIFWLKTEYCWRNKQNWCSLELRVFSPNPTSFENSGAVNDLHSANNQIETCCTQQMLKILIDCVPQLCHLSEEIKKVHYTWHKIEFVALDACVHMHSVDIFWINLMWSMLCWYCFLVEPDWSFVLILGKWIACRNLFWSKIVQQKSINKSS